MFDIARLKSIRKRLEMTQHQFAKHAGVSQSLIAKIESNSIDPSYSNVVKIEEAVTLLSKEKEPEAKNVMSDKVFSVDACASAKEIIVVMKKNSISQVPVLETGHVIGLVSETSLLEHNLEKVKTLQAKNIMTEPPPIVSEKTKLSVIAALLRQFPIVLIRQNTQLTGVITKADLLRALV